MIIGIKKAICTCGKDMKRTGGMFGGEITQDTYYCGDCQKHIIVLTPNIKEQGEFTEKLVS